MALISIPNQDLCDLQIVRKILGTKGWLLMFFTIQPFNYVTILIGYRDSNEC